MADHLVVLRLRPEPDSMGTLVALAQDLRRSGWTQVLSDESLEVWSLGPWPVTVQPTPDQGGVIVGDVFPLPASWSSPIVASAPPRARRMLEQLWGAYVAIWPCGADGAEVLRDPSGACEALIWRAPPLLFIASRLSAPGLQRWLPTLSIDGDQVGRFVLDASETTGPLALEGVEAVTPGAVWRERGGEAPGWTPAHTARSSLEMPRRAAADELRLRMDHVAQGWAGLGRPLVAEISGGLDSAIVAAALPRSAPVRRWLTFYAARPEGDERVYARAVARKLGVRLEERAKSAPSWDAASFADLSGAPRPALSAMDVDYDRAIAAETQDARAWGLATGQGGDAVFLNLRSPLIVERIVRRRGASAVLDAQVRATAEWCGTNVWSVMAACRRLKRLPPSHALPFGASSDLRDLKAAGPRHPWLKTLYDLASVKRLQIAGYVQSLIMCGETRRSRVARQIHVPLQQPLMDLGLRLPPECLVFGGRDRALAREAFADRLPHEVTARRGKGDLTASFGRGLAEALPFVRERLLDGELRIMGLIDVPALEVRLDPHELMWKGGYGDLLDLLAIEAWAVNWRKRRH